MPSANKISVPADFPSPSTAISLLGVDYFHVKTGDGGDLYFTRFGLPFWKNLLPENWHAPEWFEAKRERLEGTSMVYKVPTRPVNGRVLHLVVKWSRVGEMVPLDTLTVNKFINAEFNSPFEEFSLLMELRRGELGPAAVHIRTQCPLAIYVPDARMQLWQTGRSEDKIRAKVARHPGVEIDILRQYVVLFGWIKGSDAAETAEQFGLEGVAREEFLASVTSLVTHELWQKGYRVVDMKPQHIILRPRPDKSLLRDHNDQYAYALVDYELLERTPEHERAVLSANRQLYLEHMARRFDTGAAKPLPAHLHATNVLGVDYIYGRAESTGGLLWVVGKDPDLFTYFLPERWRRTPKKKLSARNQFFYTRTKDNINLVWKVSRMGNFRGRHSPAHGGRRRGTTASTARLRNLPLRSKWAGAACGRFIRAPFTGPGASAIPSVRFLTNGVTPRWRTSALPTASRPCAGNTTISPSGDFGTAPTNCSRRGMEILSRRQRQTRRHRQTDFPPDHDGIDAADVAAAGRLWL